MKHIFVFFAIFLAATQAAIDLPADHIEIQLNNILIDVEQLVQNVGKEFAQQFSEIVLDPLQQVDEALQAIDGRKAENEDCVNEQEEAINSTVELLFDHLNVCGVNSAKTSARIAIDVGKASKQITYDGLSILLTYQKCKNHKIKILKKTCYARFTVKATLYLNNAHKSIKIIRESKNKRIPAVFTDADACTDFALQKALTQLEEINAEIDACVEAK